jgi:hypothetical protein
MNTVRTGILMSLLFAAVGCGDMSADADDPSPNPALAGKWDVVSVNGTEVPHDSAIVLDYKPDGTLSVEQSGDLTSVPPIVAANVKKSLDDAKSSLDVESMHLKSEGSDLHVKRAQVDPKKAAP